MSVERSIEAWEEVQRHGLDLADRLTQGFTGLIQSHITPPSFSWPNPQTTKLFDVEFPAQNFVKKDFGHAIHSNSSGINDGVSAIFDIGNKLGQAGADFGAGLNGMVQQFFRRLPLPFRHEEVSMTTIRSDVNGPRPDVGVSIQVQEDLELLAKRFDYGVMDNEKVVDGSVEEESCGFNLKTAGYEGRSQGALNISTTYDSRTRGTESSLVARGDLWRVEASHGSSTSGNERSSVFLVQLGPVLFVRDSTLLLPVHLSKQHLLWYGYDRKNGMHSLCPAVWSKHRRWLLMSMVCLNPLACSFMDLQFPNGQFTYVSGEGLSTSVFLPVFGGLLQAQGQYPGEMKFSFSCKNKLGTRITPAVQWPDKSFTMGFEQVLAWKRSGLMMRPTIQFRLPLKIDCHSALYLTPMLLRLPEVACKLVNDASPYLSHFRLLPTLGGSNPGIRAEFSHSVKEDMSLNCGCALVTHPSAFASVSVGKSKWNRNVGMVLKVETPLGNVGWPSVSVKLNSGIEF